MIKIIRIAAVISVVALLGVSCNNPTGITGSASGSVSEELSGSEVSSDSSISYESGSSQDSQTSQTSQTSSGAETSSEGSSSGSISGPDEDGKLYIIKNKVANATIVISKDAMPKVMNAASDLQDHIRKMTGAIVKIGYDDRDRTEGNYILVGQSKVTDSLGIEQPKGYPENETVILKRIKNYLVLTGNDEADFIGTQYAVNMFLETQGCGWFGPDELWQVIPEKKDIVVDKLDVRHTANFITRQSNVWYQTRPFSHRWYQGGVPAMVGHALPQIVSREFYFESHPEWFSEINGVRDPYSATWWQYCYSNEEFAKEVAQKIILYFNSNPTKQQYSIAANDGWEDDWCECSVCDTFPSDTDLMLTFANRVAAEVVKKHPEKRLTILSYHSMYYAPKTNVKAHPNVEVMFCRETNMTQPIDIGFDVGSSFFPETHNVYPESWKANYESYISLSGLKNIAIWEWYCLAVERSIWKDIPWVQGNVAIRNQTYWKSKGAKYIYYDHGPLSVYRETVDSYPLRWPLWYVAAKGMWDGSLTGDQILKDACDKLFGAGSDVMFEYYHTLAEISENCTARSIAWIPPQPYEMYKSSDKKKIDGIITKAKAMLPNVTADQKARMENQIGYWENARTLIP